MGVTRRLVFHFYANKGWQGNIANICHFNCLKHFSNVFDEATIVVCDGGAGEESISEAKHLFVDIFDSIPVTVKTAQNTHYFEAETFYNEIVSKAGKLDGITFFAHNKGVSNVNDKDKSKTAILSWICGLYYYGLNFADEAEKELTADKRTTFYGPYLMTASYIKNKSNLWYAGTFYWVNAGRLLRNSDELPCIYDREYAERMPGDVLDREFLKTHNNRILIDSDLYRNWIYFAKLSSTSDDEYRGFLAFRDEMMGFFKDEPKYTVLTCNFGKYEIMREIRNKQDDVEYIYVTDDEDLTSDTWKIIYDHDLDGLTPIQKVQKVRENPFKYCSTTTCVRIDASIEVIGSLDNIVNDFHEANSDIGIMVHPERDNIFDEYDKWEEFRGLDTDEKGFVSKKLSELGCDTSVKGLYETGFMIYVNNEYVRNLLSMYSFVMGEINSEFGTVRVDQAVFSAVFNAFGNVYVFPMSHKCIQSNVLQSMEHNSCFTCIVKNIPDEGYVNGTMKKLYTINE